MQPVMHHRRHPRTLLLDVVPLVVIVVPRVAIYVVVVVVARSSVQGNDIVHSFSLFPAVCIVLAVKCK